MKVYSLLILLLLFVISGKAQPGSLDKEFGNNGFFLNPILPFGDIYGTTLQSDGKALAVGNAFNDFSVFRFTPDGLPDQHFGDSGSAKIHFQGFDFSFPVAVAYQNNNKIIVSGYSIYDYPFSKYTGMIVQLNDAGTIDSSFGKNGVIQVSQNGSGGYGPVAILPDNSFIVIGNSGSLEYLNRFKENGDLDESFGQNGYCYISTNYSYNTLKIQSDGKILIAGSYSNEGIPEFFLQRYLSNGVIDNSFGKTGTVITDYATNGSIIYDLGFQSDGKIIAFGYCVLTGDASYRFAAARYLTNGILDNSFGVDGKSTIEFNNLISSGKSVVVMANDQIIVGGVIGDTAEGPYAANYGIARLNPNGNLDSTYGTNGETVTDLGMADNIKGIFLQQNNKIIAIGESYNSTEYNCSIARYNNDDHTKKQIIVTKLKRWLQHHNGFTWDNNNNINNYIVQRSDNGIGFISIAKLNSSISSNSYDDPAPLPGNNYYRLQTTNINGAVAYSNIIEVKANDNAITISPNPAKNNLQLQGLSPSNKTKFTVVDFSGNVKQQAVVNTSSYNLNITALAPGNYLLKIEMNDAVVTKKFVKE